MLLKEVRQERWKKISVRVRRRSGIKTIQDDNYKFLLNRCENVDIVIF